MLDHKCYLYTILDLKKRRTDHHPDTKSYPSWRGELQHQVYIHECTQRRYEWHPRYLREYIEQCTVHVAMWVANL